MRGHRAQEKQQRFELIPCDAALQVQIIDQAHHRRDGRVELHALIIFRHLFDGAVDIDLQVLADPFSLIVQHLLKTPHTVEKTPAPAGAIDAPRNGLVKSAHKHFVHAEGIGPDLIDHVVGVDDVAARFAHLLAVFAQDHAMAGTALIWFRRFHHAYIMQEQVPEAAVQQMERGMLHAAVIPVHRHPVIKRFLGGKLLMIMRVAVTQEIPAGAGPLRHGIGFPPGRRAAARTGYIDPIIDQGKRAFAGIGHFVFFHLRQQQRQIGFFQRHCTAVRAMNDRDRLTPIALAAEHPVTQLIVHPALTDALFVQEADHSFFRFLHA